MILAGLWTLCVQNRFLLNPCGSCPATRFRGLEARGACCGRGRCLEPRKRTVRIFPEVNNRILKKLGVKTRRAICAADFKRWDKTADRAAHAHAPPRGKSKLQASGRLCRSTIRSLSARNKNAKPYISEVSVLTKSFDFDIFTVHFTRGWWNW